MEIYDEKIDDNFFLNRRTLQGNDDSSCKRKTKDNTTGYTIA